MLVPLIQYVIGHPWLSLLVTTTTVLSIWQLLSYHQLSHIPGPFLARFTNIPRLSWVLSYRAHEIHTELHRRYGPVVRFGPNMVSVSSVDEIPNIYRFSKPWKKSDFYHALLMKPDGKPIPGIFGTQDEGIHKQLKRPVSGAYSMTQLVKFEPYVDATMGVFCEQLAGRFADKPGMVCDLGQWLQMFAFDVIGEMTFSRRLGFLESGTDVNGVMAGIWDMFRETSLVTQMPWIDDFWTNNPIRRYLNRAASPAAVFAMNQVRERRQMLADGNNDWDRETRDFMSLFLEIEAKDPSLPAYAIPAWASSNLTAGSDTTAILLRAVFYNLLSHPSTLSRLRGELDAAAASNNSEDPLPLLMPWRRARNSDEFPYLDACVQEALRMHPSFGLPYERVVPNANAAETTTKGPTKDTATVASDGGAVIGGYPLPPGTVVGMSSWVVGRDKGLFGEDADEWRPERWLEVDDKTRKRMEAGVMAFGAGHRTCLGKNIAQLEIFKIVPTLLRHFDFELTADTDYQVQNRWLTMQSGLMVSIKKRQGF